MNDLQTIVSVLLKDSKARLTPSTYQSRQAYFNQLLDLAGKMKLSEPCTELYDAFIKDDHGSKERHSMHLLIIKMIDQMAGTLYIAPNGTFLNPPGIPSAEEASCILDGVTFPVLDSIDSGILISRVLSDLTEIGLSASSKGQYLHALRYLQAFFVKKSSSINYSSHLCKEFLKINDAEYKAGLIKEWRWKINRKSIFVIMDVAITGHYRWKKISPFELTFQDAGLESIHQEYILSLKTENYSSSTINLRDYVFRTLISLGAIENDKDLFSLSYATLEIVSKRLSEKCCLSSLSTLINIIINTLSWLWEHGYTERDFSKHLLKTFVQKGRPASYLDHENEGKVISFFDGTFLRDRAMGLLALKLGMRSIDICNLRFDEIDWQNERIRIHQHKTGEPLVLPLTPEVGNAIYDYLINERPSIGKSYPYVFLNRFAPYHKLGKMYNLCRKAIDQSGASAVGSNHKGSHLFRQTMIHRLLENNIPHQVITDTLGHTDKNSDKNYITMEASMLRMCALDLDGIGQRNWNGGDSNE